MEKLGCTRPQRPHRPQGARGWTTAQSCLHVGGGGQTFLPCWSAADAGHLRGWGVAWKEAVLAGALQQPGCQPSNPEGKGRWVLSAPHLIT